jgi:hypothetical protein
VQAVKLCCAASFSSRQLPQLILLKKKESDPLLALVEFRKPLKVIFAICHFSAASTDRRLTLGSPRVEGLVK